MTSKVLPEYLLHQLQRIASDHKFVTYKIEQDDGSKHGDGFMAEMVSVTITDQTHNSKEDPVRLICKLLPTNPARRNLFSAVRLFEREVYMYNIVLPLFFAFQARKDLQSSAFSAYPKCYYAIADATNDRYAIIMQNLRPIGLEVIDKMKGLSFGHVDSVMRELGRLHAISFALRDQQPEIFDQFREIDDLMLDMITTADDMEIVINSCYEKTIKIFGTNVDDEAKIKKCLIKMAETWKRQMHECSDPDVAEPFSVVTHGDCWNNNIMFSKGEVHAI